MHLSINTENIYFEIQNIYLSASFAAKACLNLQPAYNSSNTNITLGDKHTNNASEEFWCRAPSGHKRCPGNIGTNSKLKFNIDTFIVDIFIYQRNYILFNRRKIVFKQLYCSINNRI